MINDENTIITEELNVPDILICCHVYYFDIWKNDIEKRLLEFNDKINFDLFITLTDNIDRKSQISDILTVFPNANIQLIPNLGEDARGFAACVEWLRETKQIYKYILKIHTKSETQWRTELLNSLIRTDDNFINNILTDDFGFYSSKKYYLYSNNPNEWNFNGQWLGEEKDMVGCKTRTTNHFSGTMFWISYDIVERYFINSEKFCSSYFNQPYNIGYTKQHSFELLIGCIAYDCGKKIIIYDYGIKEEIVKIDQYKNNTVPIKIERFGNIIPPMRFNNKSQVIEYIPPKKSNREIEKNIKQNISEKRPLPTRQRLENKKKMSRTLSVFLR